MVARYEGGWRRRIALSVLMSARSSAEAAAAMGVVVQAGTAAGYSDSETAAGLVGESQYTAAAAEVLANFVAGLVLGSPYIVAVKELDRSQ